MELGYARVSTTHQDLARQLDALAKHGIPEERIYADKKTGATIDRAGFTELLRYARTGDTIVATNLDRLGRNLRECLNVVHDLREKGVGIKTLSDPIPIDTTDHSPMAELAVALLALFAHMERVFMRERAAHARAVAAAKGKRAGRPRKLSPAQVAAARAAVAAGQHVNQVAAAFKVSRATLYRHLPESASAG
jgi:DNA invertase Pin-like site-specific DNA recombinase